MSFVVALTKLPCLSPIFPLAAVQVVWPIRLTPMSDYTRK